MAGAESARSGAMNGDINYGSWLCVVQSQSRVRFVGVVFEGKDEDDGAESI